MKTARIPAICAAVVVILLTAAFITKSAATKHQNNQEIVGNGFAVLELFTSEGCSSCPPADALLARVQKEAGNKPIYVLAYHVDYWDRLGWRDKFSNREFSKRQYQYSRQFAGQVYTPQLIINGKAECVGSDESAVNNAISDALNGPCTMTLNISGRQQPGAIDLDYQVSGKAGNSQLLIAVVQKHAVSKVESGENGGRSLSHAQIVRDFSTFNLKPGQKGTERIGLPKGFNTKDWEIIGLIQNPETGVINAAARVAISPAA